jgi:hypothetical protein
VAGKRIVSAQALCVFDRVKIKVRECKDFW